MEHLRTWWWHAYFSFCLLPCFSWHVGPNNGQKFRSFISKSGKITIHRLLFTDYCSRITVHGSLFTNHCLLLLFMTLFTPKFCLFKEGCPLNFRGSQVKFTSDFSSLRTSLLRERTYLTSTTTTTTTTLLIFVHYKPCNPTNLVTRTSSSFVTVEILYSLLLL